MQTCIINVVAEKGLTSAFGAYAQTSDHREKYDSISAAPSFGLSSVHVGAEKHSSMDIDAILCSIDDMSSEDDDDNDEPLLFNNKTHHDVIAEFDDMVEHIKQVSQATLIAKKKEAKEYLQNRNVNPMGWSVPWDLRAKLVWE